MYDALRKSGIIKSKEQKITEMLSFAKVNGKCYFELYGSEFLQRVFYFDFGKNKIVFESNRLVGTCDPLVEIIHSPMQSTKRARRQKQDTFQYQDITEDQVIDQLFDLFEKEILTKRYK